VEREQYEKLDRLEDTSWWFRLKRDFVYGWLEAALRERPDHSPAPPLVLDVGCGAGGVLARIPFAARRLGLELDAQQARVARARGIERIARSRAEALPLRARTVDAVLMLDVLEHLEEDEAALRDVHRVLAPGGVLLVTVPAHPFLWSPHDVAFHHCRRYTRRELERKLNRAGLVPRRLSWAFLTAFPAACVVRPMRRLLARLGLGPKVVDDFQLMPSALESLAYAVTRWEARWLRRGTLPIGLSLIALCKRDDLTPG
jgi:SAM-dependent methyltransferase